MVADQSRKCPVRLVSIMVLLTLAFIIRRLRKSTSDCRRDRPHRMHHIRRQRTPQPITQSWFNIIIRCHHHKDQSRSYLTVLHPSCRRLRNKTRRCFTHPTNRWINRATTPRFAHRSCRPEGERAVRTRSVERSTAWIIAIHGVRSASGRRLAAVLVTENY